MIKNNTKPCAHLCRTRVCGIFVSNIRALLSQTVSLSLQVRYYLSQTALDKGKMAFGC